MDLTQRRMRLMAITQWINVRIASGKQYAIETIHHSGNVSMHGNKANVSWRSSRRLNCLAVVAREIETVGFQFDPHRDADARPVVVHLMNPRLQQSANVSTRYHSSNFTFALFCSLVNFEYGSRIF